MVSKKGNLTVNSIWGVGTIPPIRKKIRFAKKDKCNQDDFLLVLPKSFRKLLKQFSKL